MHRSVPAAVTAVASLVALAGCALGPGETPGSATASNPSTSVATSAASSGSASASSTATGLPSVAPGTVMTPREFVADMRAAMRRESSYEYVTDTTLTAGGNSASQKVHTVVDQTDRDHPKVLTETTAADTTMQLIMIGDTQYSRTSSGKYHKSPIPADATATYIAPGAEIEQGAKSITYVGPDQVDGAEAHHYTAEMQNYPGATPTPGADAQGSGYDIWTDSQGRLLRIKSVMQGSTSTQTYSHYSSAPAVNAPDPADVEG